MLISLGEFVDMLLMVGIIGFLFKDMMRAPVATHDPVARYRVKRNVHWDDFWWACALIAPGILLHELAHKFTAMGFGQAATFHAACSVSQIGTGSFLDFTCILQIAVVALKMIGIPFLIFIPGYVSFSSGVAPFAGALIALAGPLVHLAFWGVCTLLLKRKAARKYSMRKRLFFAFTAKINLFLFIFNILPIPGFDGFQVVRFLLSGVF